MYLHSADTETLKLAGSVYAPMDVHWKGIAKGSSNHNLSSKEGFLMRS